MKAKLNKSNQSGSNKKNQPNKTALKANGRLVIGRRACLELLTAFPERVNLAYVAKANNNDLLDNDLEKLLNQHRVKKIIIDRDQLAQICNSSSHQGYVLELRQHQPVDLKSFINASKESTRQVVLALDDIQDPHNLGAILRVAECFGIAAVIWSKNRGCGITATVSKTSAGASELVTCIEVANLHDALLKLKENGFWLVATAKTEKAESIKNFEWPDKTVILLGGEGSGISKLLLKESDFQVWIPLQGRIGSLNVAQSAAIVAYSVCGSEKYSKPKK